MRLGVDFDNTLVCYDGLFHDVAVAWGLLAEDGPRDKDGVRNWFVECDREEDFTRLQGEVYGPGLQKAFPYPGALECLAGLKAKGASLFLISHKTSRPVLGPAHNLRAAARNWLEAKGFISQELFAPADIFFEDTIAAKAARIAALGCTHFIDDLERFLLCPEFPPGVARLLFKPSARPVCSATLAAFSDWRELPTLLPS